MHPRYAALLLLLMLAPAAPAATYYVRPDGNDANNGLADSPAGGWLTLQKAAGSVEPGDTVRIRPGKYAGFIHKTDGVEGRPIAYLADAGAVITAPGNPNDGRPIGIDLDHADDVIVDGFEIDGSSWNAYIGIRSYGGDGKLSRRNMLRNNKVHGYDYCAVLASWQAGGVAKNNECYDAKRNGIYYGNSGQDSALDGNYIHDVGKHGIILNGDAKAGGEGLMLRMAVRNNRIVNAGKDVSSNGDGCGVCCLGARDGTIQNNLIVNSGTDGIRLDQGPDSAGGSDHNVVANNTVNGAGSNCLSIRQGSYNLVFNNIFYNDATYNPKQPTSIRINYLGFEPVGNKTDYNAVGDCSNGYKLMTFREWQADAGDPHGVNLGGGRGGNDRRDKLFVNWSAGDYRLKPNTPAGRAGVASFGGKPAPADDITGAARGAWDLGAYAFTEKPQGSPAIPPATLDRPGGAR
jgi:hypothetical protein